MAQNPKQKENPYEWENEKGEWKEFLFEW